MDDFLAWLGSQEEQNSEQALFHVMDALNDCSVDPAERVLVWNDGKRLSISQTAQRIYTLSNSPVPHILSHVVSWLEMHMSQKVSMNIRWNNLRL